tara:strand:- start:2141 stop:2320 length:180 start_codon:yes stop_codon:yes gene_type:complete
LKKLSSEAGFHIVLLRGDDEPTAVFPVANKERIKRFAKDITKIELVKDGRTIKIFKEAK